MLKISPTHNIPLQSAQIVRSNAGEANQIIEFVRDELLSFRAELCVF